MVENVNVTYIPQRNDHAVSYSFDGEAITATVDNQTDTIDLSSVPDGEAATITSTLIPCPVLSARREDGVLNVTLLRTIGPRPTDEAELATWHSLWTDIEETV